MSFNSKGRRAESQPALRRVAVWGFVFLFLSLSVLGALALWPFRSALIDAQQKALLRQNDRAGAAIGTLFHGMAEISRQLASRTQVRMKLVEFLAGGSSLEEAREFISQRMEDGVNSSPEVLGLIRLDPEGNVMTAIGATVPEARRPSASAEELSDPDSPRPTFGKPLQSDGGGTIVIRQPVIDPTVGRVGTDFVLFDLSPVIEELSSLASFWKSARVALLGQGSEVLLKGSDEVPATGTPGDRVVARSSIPDMPWTLATGVDRSELLAPARRQLARVARAVLAISLVAGLLGVAALRRFAGTMMLRAEELEDIVRRRTADLEELSVAAQRGSNAKSVFLAHVSHEIRTPMTGILGLLSLLEQSSLGKEEAEYVRLAKQAGDGLLSLLNDILDFSAAEAGRLHIEAKPTDLEALGKEAVDLFRHKGMEKATAVEFRREGPAIPLLMSDPNRIRQVLANLIGNAVKFTDRGVVTLVVYGVPAGEQSYDVRIDVVDTGVGIPEDQLPELFSPFSRVSETAGGQVGSGLGLGICRSIVEQMGGRITVSSTPGEGSCFSVFLTLPEAGAPTETEHPSMPTDRQAVNVLLAEDNAISRLAVGRMIERMGYSPLFAENGLEVLAVLQKESVDVILMDIQMPELGGLETTRRVRSGETGTATVPIIGLSAFTDPEERERAIDAGMDDYLIKPVDMDTLKKQLRRATSRDGESIVSGGPGAER